MVFCRNQCYHWIQELKIFQKLSEPHFWKIGAMQVLKISAPNQHCIEPHHGAVQCGASWDIIANVCAWGTCVADSIGAELSKILFRVTQNTPVCRRGNRNSKKAVHTEHAQNNVHFDGTKRIGSGPRTAWACLEHMSQLVRAVHNGAPRQVAAVRCGADLCVLKCVLGFRYIFVWLYNHDQCGSSSFLFACVINLVPFVSSLGGWVYCFSFFRGCVYFHVNKTTTQNLMEICRNDAWIPKVTECMGARRWHSRRHISSWD